MPNAEAETGSRNELLAAAPGLIIGIVTAAISDLPAPLRLVIAALLAIVYWSWPRLAARRRRAVREAPEPTTPQPASGHQPAAGGYSDPPRARRPGRRWVPLAATLAVAVLLNVLALVLVGGSLTVLLFVVAWLLALALPLRLAELSEPLRSALYQATAVSVGAALAIGGQPIVHEVARSDQGKVFWHAGWRVSLGDPTLAHDQEAGGGAVLSIPAVFENLGDETARFNSQLVVTTRGKHYTEPGPGQELPEVPGRARQAGTIAFKVDPASSLDDAILTVGQSDRAQAVVPLGKSGKLVSLAPRPIRVDGKVHIDDFVVEVHGGELRADAPEGYAEANRGHAYVRLRVSVTHTGVCVPCGTFLSLDNQHYMKLPDGTSASPAGECTSADYPGPGEISRDQLLCFQVPAGVPGEYRYFRKGNEADGLRFRIT